MKILATLSLAFVASAAFAGQPVMDSSKKGPIPLEPCFQDKELQLDIFASYVWANGKYDDGIGGGLGVNYYFSRNIGLGVDAQLTDADNDSALWQFTGNILVRFPIENNGTCFAPYLKFGGGYQMDGSGDFIYGGGAGIEFRVTPRLGIFGEGGYYWAESDNNFAQARVGVRLVFW